MAESVEVLMTGDESVIGKAVLNEATRAARELGWQVSVTHTLRGASKWLCLFGVGHELRNAARKKQIERGGRVACWDLGYIMSGKEPGISYLRVSVDHNHPWRDFDATPNDQGRLAVLSVQLRDTYNEKGPVIVIGMGPKSRRHLGLNDWEKKTLEAARKEFPTRKILYRPKPITKKGVPINRDRHINWPLTKLGKIEEALNGASLVITRHSNVAVDACIANIPVRCEDGAAYWLYRDNAHPSVEQRQDFLCRLAYWQYRTDEQKEAWQFLQKTCG